jgi:hypothetical protein
MVDEVSVSSDAQSTMVEGLTGILGRLAKCKGLERAGKPIYEVGET